MRKNTLLDFVLSTADTQSIREFWDVLAADGDREKAEKLLKKIIKMTERDEHIDKEDAGLAQRALRGLFGKTKKSVLDMDPAELKRLLEVVETGNDLEFEEGVDLTEDFEHPQKPEELKRKIASFYNQNRSFISHADDISFDEKDHILKFKGSKELAEQFVKILGLKPDVQTALLTKQYESVFASGDVTLQKSDFISDEKYSDFAAFVKKFKLHNPKKVKTATFNAETGELDFLAGRSFVKTFFRQGGIKPESIQRILQESKKVSLQKIPTTEVGVNMPIDAQGLGFSQSDEDAAKAKQDLSDWLKQNGRTKDTAQIVKEPGGEYHLRFTGNPDTFLVLMQGAFGIGTKDATQYIKNYPYTGEVYRQEK